MHCVKAVKNTQILLLTVPCLYKITLCKTISNSQILRKGQYILWVVAKRQYIILYWKIQEYQDI